MKERFKDKGRLKFRSAARYAVSLLRRQSTLEMPDTVQVQTAEISLR